MTGQDPGGGGHRPQLDGLRAVAAAAVLVDHFTGLDARLPVSVSKAGVWLFFVLSGYLITGILARARDAADADADAPGARGGAWRAFAARRVLRLWPLYYATLVGVALIGLPDARRVFPWAAVHLTNVGLFLDVVAHDHWNRALMHFWTLAVEEQFYLVWPPVVLFAPRRLLLPVAVAAVLAGPVSRVAVVAATGSHMAADCVPACSLDALGLGAVLALTERPPGPAARRRRRPAWLLGALAGGAGLLALAVAAAAAGVSPNRTTVAERFAYALLATWAVGRAAPGFAGPIGRFLTLPPVLYLGRISYGVYVLHFPVEQTLRLVARTTGLPVAPPAGSPLLALAYVSTATVLAASASWYLLERPLNGLKRFVPYPSPPPPLPAGEAVAPGRLIGCVEPSTTHRPRGPGP